MTSSEVGNDSCKIKLHAKQLHVLAKYFRKKKVV